MAFCASLGVHAREPKTRLVDIWEPGLIPSAWKTHSGCLSSKHEPVLLHKAALADITLRHVLPFHVVTADVCNDLVLLSGPHHRQSAVQGARTWINYGGNLLTRVHALTR